MHAVDLFMSCRLTAAGYLAAEAAGKTRGKGEEEAGGGGAQQDGAGEEEARGDEDGGGKSPRCMKSRLHVLISLQILCACNTCAAGSQGGGKASQAAEAGCGRG